jgi:hypothetical protein
MHGRKVEEQAGCAKKRKGSTIASPFSREKQ